MKRNTMKAIAVLLMTVLLSACGNNDSKVDQVIQDQIEVTDSEENNSGDVASTDTSTSQIDGESSFLCDPDPNVDVDLTALSSTMVYSEVYNMITTPEDYIGKLVKMKGTFVIYTNDDESQYYPAVIIADATACCSQGLEYILEGNPPYPEGYPELDTEITVTGTFETYEEDGNTYCRLQNAKLD